MNIQSSQRRYLLDKNIIRYAVTGLHYGHQRLLSSLEAGVLSFWQASEIREDQLFISLVSFRVLERLARYDEVRVFLGSVEVLSPTRYHTRWTRRVRETTGLSPEDAAMVALASFGANQSGTILGTHRLVTYDQPLINGYQRRLSILKRRLRAMTIQLSPPFDQATLPQIITPDAIQLQ